MRRLGTCYLFSMPHSCPIKIGRIAKKLDAFCGGMPSPKRNLPGHHAKANRCQNHSMIAMAFIRQGRCAEARYHLREAIKHARSIAKHGR